jgi:hypothetical protein
MVKFETIKELHLKLEIYSQNLVYFLKFMIEDPLGYVETF